MENNKIAIPVLLITYKKHNFIAEIMDQINKFAPSKLYIFQNKYKSNEEKAEYELVVQQLQKHIYQGQFEYIPHENHLPITQSITTAIDYVFSLEEKLIVLEDDVIPNMAFFQFCVEMLQKYEYSQTIGCINGCNLGSSARKDGYFLSSLATPFWGWATWKDKWQKYKGDNLYWIKKRKEIISNFELENRRYLEGVFDFNAMNMRVWDLQWNLSLLYWNLQTIVPTTNYINNKGFLVKGTSISYTDSTFNTLETTQEINALQLAVNPIFKRNYEQKIVDLFNEIGQNSEDNIHHRILSK